jgi:O-antigen/teichoic acid export membrane protein
MFKRAFIFVKNDRLARGSLILFVGSFAAGILSYVFNMLMSRMLGPEDYGAFASLISLTYITGVPAGTIAVVVTKKISSFHANGELGKGRNFVIHIVNQSAIIGALVSLVFLALTPIIMEFLKIDSPFPILILGVSFFISFISAVPSGGLRGLEKFFEISLSGIFSILIRIVLGIILVLIGWRVSGGLTASLCADILATILVFYYLKLPKERLPLESEDKKISSFALPVFFATLCMAALYNADVILAKHFLSITDAGYYATLSLLGKIIFFGTASIGVVIFPLTAKNHSQGLDNSRILKFSILITLVASSLVTLAYFLFPELIIKVLFGASYLPVSIYVGWMGVVFILYSLVNVLVAYALSCNKTGITYILLLGTALEILSISVFHSSIFDIICAMIVVMSLTLGGLVIYLRFGKKVKKWITTAN